MFTPNYYPNLQTPYFNPQMSFTQTQPQIQQNADVGAPNNSSGIIWVQGEAGAKAYPVLRNNIVALWDSENQTIYIKSADGTGKPTMRILDWTERQAPKNVLENTENTNINTENNPKYVTREEFDDVVKRLNNIANKIGNSKQKLNNLDNNVNSKNKEDNNNG